MPSVVGAAPGRGRAPSGSRRRAAAMRYSASKSPQVSIAACSASATRRRSSGCSRALKASMVSSKRAGVVAEHLEQPVVPGSRPVTRSQSKVPIPAASMASSHAAGSPRGPAPGRRRRRGLHSCHPLDIRARRVPGFARLVVRTSNRVMSRTSRRSKLLGTDRPSSRSGGPWCGRGITPAPPLARRGADGRPGQWPAGAGAPRWGTGFGAAGETAGSTRRREADTRPRPGTPGSPRRPRRPPAAAGDRACELR